MSDSSKRYLNLDALTGIRFFAAIMVVVFHYGRTAVPFAEGWANGLARMGVLAVSFFFVLSGFIMAFVYYGRSDHKGRFSRADYYRARFARIYPLYFLAMAFAVGLFTHYAPFNSEASALYMGKVAAATFLVQSWIPDFAMSVNGPGWSLAVEALFYALFPLIFPWFRSLSTRWVVIAGGLFWLAGFLLDDRVIHFWFSGGPEVVHAARAYFPVWHLSSFLVGMSLGVLVKRGCLTSIPAWFWSLLLIPMCLLLLNLPWLFGLLQSTSDALLGRRLDWLMLAHNGVIAPLWGLFLVCLVLSHRWVDLLLGNPVMRFLGEASYAVYILQYPVWTLLRMEVFKPLSINDPTQKFYINVLVLLLLSCLLFKLYESPLRRLLGVKRKVPQALPEQA